MNKHHFALVLRTELATQIAGRAAHQRRHLGGIETDQAASHDGAVGTHQVDRVARDEVAIDPGDPGRKQRGAPLDDSRDRARIEDDPAPRFGGVREPQEAGAGSTAGGVEVRADIVAGERLGGEPRGGQDDGESCTGGDPGRLDLGDHAAAADLGPTRATDLHRGEVVDTADVETFDASAAEPDVTATPFDADTVSVTCCAVSGVTKNTMAIAATRL